MAENILPFFLRPIVEVKGKLKRDAKLSQQSCVFPAVQFESVMNLNFNGQVR